jgi:hypothetical protein
MTNFGKPERVKPALQANTISEPAMIWFGAVMLPLPSEV